MRLQTYGPNMNAIIVRSGFVVLFSFQTPVAFALDGVFFKTKKKFSRTTSKHIAKWAKLNSSEYTHEVEQQEIEGIINTPERRLTR